VYSNTNSWHSVSNYSGKKHCVFRFNQSLYFLDIAVLLYKVVLRPYINYEIIVVQQDTNVKIKLTQKSSDPDDVCPNPDPVLFTTFVYSTGTLLYVYFAKLLQSCRSNAIPVGRGERDGSIRILACHLTCHLNPIRNEIMGLKFSLQDILLVNDKITLVFHFYSIWT
jgi:hypothetical protein